MRKSLLAFILACGGIWLSGCASSSGVDGSSGSWVVVHFEDNADYMAMGAADALLDTELAADEALQAAGAGFIDGNEVGDFSYDLYFVGSDAEVMWAILEPVFDAAPVEWSTVELLQEHDDEDPIVIVREP